MSKIIMASNRVRNFFDKWFTTIVTTMILSVGGSGIWLLAEMKTSYEYLSDDVRMNSTAREDAVRCDSSLIRMINDARRDILNNKLEYNEQLADLKLRMTRAEKLLGLPPIDWDKVLLPQERIKTR